MLLYDHEKYLTDGRFRQFTREEQKYIIEIKNNFLDNQDELIKKTTIMINWIYNNTNSIWSVRVEYIDYDTIFSFQNDEEAFLFKMVFG